MINIDKVKLVVWDLDDTFWQGTLSEGEIMPSSTNIQLVKDLTDCGIINTICSKNDYDAAKNKLDELGVFDLFVFCSINWENKAMRLKALIENMALRPANVLFLDDNVFNINEAKHVLPDLMTAMPNEIPMLINQISSKDKKDTGHKRLKQYKILEKKSTESKKFDSNEDFLFSSNIRVDICYDCDNEIERIHELIMRSNQLNFTKKRISQEELSETLHNKKYKCGYVKVKDNYGDYGLVGFFALIDGCLEHFLFSCRTMGQQIEQYVYAKLDFPKLEVVGEVRTQLDKESCPKWINQVDYVNTQTSQYESNSINAKILIKGPCDLANAKVYLSNTEGVDFELTYIRDEKGQSVFSYNHSAQIENILDLTREELDKLCEKCHYIDPKSTYSNILSRDYRLIVLSALLETDHAIYKEKNGNGKVVIGQHNEDITQEKEWKRCTTNGVSYYIFTNDEIREFSNHFEYIGYTKPSDYIVFLNKLLNRLPKETHLCILLGATKYYQEDPDTLSRHSLFNKEVLKAAENNPRLWCLEIDNCITGPNDFAGHVNHFTSQVYYKIAQNIATISSNVLGYGNIRVRGKSLMLFDSVLKKMTKHIAKDSVVYKIAYRMYNMLTHRVK